jgi:MFS family permease
MNDASSYPSPARAGWGVLVLYLAYLFAFVDRQIVAFLVEPIRKAFDITDFQFSLLNGLAFVLFYALLGIPLGRLADSRNRRNIIAIGITTWSIMTALCGRATNFLQLFLARLGVGVGEAALAPAGVSMIADMYPREQRGLAINLFSSGVLAGIGIANIFGGIVVGMTSNLGATTLPVLGAVQGWQLAFLLAATPGIIVLLLVLTLREPARHGTAKELQPVTVRETLKYMDRHRLVYGTMILGTAFSAIGGYGMYGWVPTAFKRSFGWSSAAIGWRLGILAIVFGTLGLALSGWYAGKRLKAGGSAAYMRMMAFSVLGAAIAAACSFFATTANELWVCVAAQIFFLGMPVGLVQGGLQAITPNNMVAQVIAIYLTALNLFGMGIGPSAVAFVTDFVFHADDAVRYSIGVVIVCAALISATLLFSGMRAFERLAATRI